MPKHGKRYRALEGKVDRSKQYSIDEAAALVLDRVRRDDIIGTLAGEDTIFVVARTTADAENIMEEFHAMMLG